MDAPWSVSSCMRLKKRQKNFVIAMGVFGNSNSLPISLVISLSQTLRGLHWDKVPNDNDDEVELVAFSTCSSSSNWDSCLDGLGATMFSWLQQTNTRKRMEVLPRLHAWREVQVPIGRSRK